MILTGRLSDWSVADLLQIMQVTGKTAALRIEAEDRSGTVFFRDGRVVDAALSPSTHGASPWDRAIETTYVLRLLSDGSFSVGTEDPQDPDELGFETREVLETTSELVAREAGLRERGVLDGALVALKPVVGHAVGISAEDWPTLRDLIGEPNLAALEERLGRVRALAALELLDRMGVTGSTSADLDQPEVTGHEVSPEIPPETRGEMPESQLDEEPDGPLPINVIRLTELEQGPTAVPELPADRSMVGDEAGPSRKEMRALISPADTTLVPGVLDDLRTRFRNVDGGSHR